VRANKGLLLTSEPRQGASAPVKDMGETVQRLTQARQQHEELSKLAQQHKAQTPDASQGDVTGTIKVQNDAIKGGTKTNSNPSPEMTRPDVVIASAAGIATTAADSTHMASHHDHAITTGRDMSVSAGRSFHVASLHSVSMFAYQQGMKFIANGRVDIQSQQSEIAMRALNNITVSSSNGKLILTAKEEVWIGANGSYIQINGSGIVNGSPGLILEKGAKWSKSEASTMYPRLTAFATHPIKFNCGEMTALEQGVAEVPPAPSTNGGGAASQSSGSASVAPTPSAPGGTIEPGCSFHIDSVVDARRPLNIGSGNYWTVKKDGTPYLLGGQPYFISYANYEGMAEFRYYDAIKKITATVRILLKPMEINETDPSGHVVSVAYNADKDPHPNLYPGRVPAARPVQALAGFMVSAKIKIERELNSQPHQITTADCPKGNACQCRIPVQFIVEFLTSDSSGTAHKTVSIYPTAHRANAANWGESVATTDNYGNDAIYPINQEHVHTHEVGHLLGFPDEYYWDGGAMDKQYIDGTSHLNLPLAKNNPNSNIWQGTTPDTLMGNGVYGPNLPRLPKYYLSQICKWFKEKNGYEWKAV
jgi:uncharacterized protein (DUF2345 family)